MPSWFESLRDRFGLLPAGKRRWLVTGFFLLAQVFIWLVAFQVFWYADRSITDTPVYYNYAGHIARGMVPYRDFSLEYPPVATLLFSLPRLISGPAYNRFVIAFETEMLLFSCAIVLVLSGIAWRQWRSVGRLAGVLGSYTLFLLFLGSIVELRFDLAAAFVILASVACFVTDRRLAAWLLLGIGIMTKIIPVLIAPLFLISHYRRRQFSQLISGPALMIATALAIALPFLLVAPAGLANAFLYHVERPLQLESTWSSPLLLASKYSGYSVSIMNSYGSHNVFSSLSNTLASLSAPVTMLVMLAGYGVYWSRSRDDSAAVWDSSQVIRFAAVIVAIFIFGGKVFSPQFLIWLLPLIPLIKGRDRGIILGVFAAVLLLTQWEFPARYWELYLLQKQLVLEVAARNALLGLLIVIMMVSPGRDRGIVTEAAPEAERVAA